MSDAAEAHRHGHDTAPGDEMADEHEVAQGILGYFAGFGFAVILTVGSFFIANTTLVWAPSIPIALAVLAIAQMGVHLVFFLHIGTGPDSTNNVMALAFGLLIVLLMMTGSLWIMSHLDHNMMPIDKVMQMQR